MEVGAAGALKEGAVGTPAVDGAAGVVTGAETTVGAFEEETLGEATPLYVTFLTTPSRESQ